MTLDGKRHCLPQEAVHHRRAIFPAAPTVYITTHLPHSPPAPALTLFVSCSGQRFLLPGKTQGGVQHGRVADKPGFSQPLSPDWLTQTQQGLPISTWLINLDKKVGEACLMWGKLRK